MKYNYVLKLLSYVIAVAISFLLGWYMSLPDKTKTNAAIVEARISTAIGKIKADLRYKWEQDSICYSNERQIREREYAEILKRKQELQKQNKNEITRVSSLDNVESIKFFTKWLRSISN